MLECFQINMILATSVGVIKHHDPKQHIEEFKLTVPESIMMGLMWYHTPGVGKGRDGDVVMSSQACSQ